MTKPVQTVHASCVAVGGRGVLILGPSGAGKSSLALQLMAYGASLVADDQTQLWVEADLLLATAPEAIQGMIEARGIGILRAAYLLKAEIVLVIDLGETETARLPPLRHITLHGQTRPLLRGPLVPGAIHPHLAASVLCYLKGPQTA